jgi:cell division protein FtsL
VPSPASQRVEQKRIFGLTAGERMILSIIFFIAVSVLSVALLFITNTIVIP